MASIHPSPKAQSPTTATPAWTTGASSSSRAGSTETKHPIPPGGLRHAVPAASSAPPATHVVHAGGGKETKGKTKVVVDSLGPPVSSHTIARPKTHRVLTNAQQVPSTLF